MTHASQAVQFALAISLLPGLAQSQSTERVSLGSARVQSDGGCGSMSLSADARFVALSSVATNFTAGDVFMTSDLFVRDRHTGLTQCITLDSGGMPASGESYDPMMSADGRCVAFYSQATNLLAGDTTGKVDVFVRDLVNGTLQIASLSSTGAQGDSDSATPAVSADGNIVAFASRATNLVAGDTNGGFDVFVRDLAAGTTERVSVSTGGVQGNDWSFNPSISGDGRFVAFTSFGSNLVA